MASMILKNSSFEKKTIGIDVLRKLAFQIGTVLKVEPIKKAKKPSYEMDTVFNQTKKSCGQFTRNYSVEDLKNKQIVGLTNLPPVRIAGIKSECLTLGYADENNDGQAIPLTPCFPVKNGQLILFLDEKSGVSPLNNQADYKDFESVEILSATITSFKKSENMAQYCLVDFGNEKHGEVLVPGTLKGDCNDFIGLQIPVITNLQKSIDNSDTVFLALTAPTDDDINFVTLIKIDKPVKNGLNIF